MALDPRLMPLCDAIVNLVVADIVREIETKNAVDPAKEVDGVKDEREQHRPRDSVFPRANA